MIRVAGATKDFAAKSSIDCLMNGRRDRHMKTTCPDAVVCTAATKATLFSEPLPGLPPTPWRAVVVVKQDGAAGLCIAHYESL